MEQKANLESATVNIMLTINGEIHLVGFKKDRMDAISHLVKAAAEVAVPTGKTQAEFNTFLGYKG